MAEVGHTTSDPGARGLPSGFFRGRTLALLLLALVAAAALLEGGLIPRLGGPVIAAVGILGALVAARTGSAAAPPAGGLVRRRLGVLLVLASLTWATVPVPWSLREAVAPLQAARIAEADPTAAGDADPWFSAMMRYDLDAALGIGAWSFDPLEGVRGAPTLPGALAPSRMAWPVAKLAGAAAAYVVGRRIGGSERGSRLFLLGLLLFAVGEALFGLANRNGPSTGLGPKLHYLGSATGTFINRGHFGAFLGLGLAAAWGLAAGLFPLEAEEVTRHRRHRHRSSQPPGLIEAAGDRVPRLALLALAAGLVGVGMVASQSRGPLLGFGVAAALVAVACARWRGERFHLWIGVGFPLAVGAASLVGFGLRGTLGRFLELVGGGGESVSARLRLWNEGLAAFLEAPVFGAGPGGWRLAWSPQETGPHLFDFAHAHAEPLHQLVELGLVGAVGWAWILLGWLVAVLRGLRAGAHGPRFAAGVGALVGTLGVLLQSWGDFPLHTPGVLLAVAATAGIARGALSAPAPGRGWVGVGIAAVVLALTAAWQDRAPGLSREERMGEVPRAWFSIRDEADPLAFARAQAARSPLDPWLQTLLAREEAVAARRAAREERATDEHAWRADLAMHRALRLRPRDGRIELELGRVMLALVDVTSTPDAWRARATEHLAAAVRNDAWRAPDAFELADDLPASALPILAAGAPGEGKLGALVRYELGQALARRGQRDAAVAAYREACTLDPGLGQAWFQLGVQLRAAGDEPGALEAWRSFLGARERPGGMHGWTLVFLGELDAADARLRQVVAEQPKNKWAWEGLAEAARRRGDTGAERLAWRALHELGDPRAAGHLQALGVP